MKKKEEGNTLFHQGRHEEAYGVYSHALDIDPLNNLANAKLHCNRALVCSRVSYRSM